MLRHQGNQSRRVCILARPQIEFKRPEHGTAEVVAVDIICLGGNDGGRVVAYEFLGLAVRVLAGSAWEDGRLTGCRCMMHQVEYLRLPDSRGSGGCDMARALPLLQHHGMSVQCLPCSGIVDRTRVSLEEVS
jgi:hypothetical protein